MPVFIYFSISIYSSFFYYFFISINIPKYFDATKYYEQADGDGLHHRDVPPTLRRCPECNKLNLKYNGGPATKVKDQKTPRPPSPSDEVIVISDSPLKQ